MEWNGMNHCKEKALFSQNAGLLFDLKTRATFENNFHKMKMSNVRSQSNFYGHQ